MTSIPFLQKGDRVAFISTAKKVTREGIESAMKVMQYWGLEVVLGKHLFNEDKQFAGTDDQRAADLQWALDNPNIKAIICCKGGYGTVRVVDEINFEAFKDSPKWVVGYSDITVLHSHIHQVLGLSSLHATMPMNFPAEGKASGDEQEALDSLRNALFGETLRVDISLLKKYQFTPFEGELVGGNLSILYSLLGSASDINTENKILFIEDLDEYLYHVDRMMVALKRAGKFRNIKGLIVGGLSDMNDNAVPFGRTAEEIVMDNIKEYNFPVIFNFPAGHVDRNLAVRLGGQVKLTNTEFLG